MEKTKLILHIGFPKTGTTTLQNGLFYKLHLQNKIEFLGRSNEPDFFGQCDTRVQFNNQFYVPQPRNKKFDRHGFKPLFEVLKQGVVNVVSDENFTFPNNFLHKHEDVKFDRIELLGNLIQEARSIENLDMVVVLCIRKQSDILRSLFTHWYAYLQANFSKKELNSESFILDKLSSDVFRLQLDYYQWIIQIQSLVGVENVEVMFFEDLKSDLISISSKYDSLLNLEVGMSHALLENAMYNTKTVKSSGTQTKSFKKSSPLVHNLNKSGFLKPLKKLVPSSIKNLVLKEESAIVPFWSDDYIEKIMSQFDNSPLLSLKYFDKGKLMDYGYIKMPKL